LLAIAARPRLCPRQCRVGPALVVSGKCRDAMPLDGATVGDGLGNDVPLGHTHRHLHIVSWAFPSSECKTCRLDATELSRVRSERAGRRKRLLAFEDGGGFVVAQQWGALAGTCGDGVRSVLGLPLSGGVFALAPMRGQPRADTADNGRVHGASGDDR